MSRSISACVSCVRHTTIQLCIYEIYTYMYIWDMYSIHIYLVVCLRVFHVFRVSAILLDIYVYYTYLLVLPTVASYYCICVRILLCIYVRILRHTCPHATACVRILLHMCPHSTRFSTSRFLIQVSFLEEHTYSLPNEYQVIISAIAAVIIERGLSP